ncbi:MAG TPA: L,D-transpeptidase [Xanthobacteraceae bacterium]|jgi:lipoprotein-anchoring transpeptidase ErfK/SrfK|nr:L,D-transpeptidase [Xanthobacteraceae bacterium]
MRPGIALAAVIAASTLLSMTSAEAARSRSAAQPQGATTKEVVDFDGDLPQGTIVIKTAEHKLYYTLGDGKAVRYAIAVGKPKFQWSGNLWISAKYRNPSWRPTARMRRENPRLPKVVGPGPHNPLGIRAMYLGWSEYRIHGTNAPYSIGSSASSGCFRMHNADAADLFERAHLGAPVVVSR